VFDEVDRGEIGDGADRQQGNREPHPKRCRFLSHVTAPYRALRPCSADFSRPGDNGANRIMLGQELNWLASVRMTHACRRASQVRRLCKELRSIFPSRPPAGPAPVLLPARMTAVWRALGEAPLVTVFAFLAKVSQSVVGLLVCRAGRQVQRRGGSSPPAIGRDALIGDPHALGQSAGLPEHVDRNAAARIPVAADA
jgi:hypothetical protein